MKLLSTFFVTFFLVIVSEVLADTCETFGGVCKLSECEGNEIQFDYTPSDSCTEKHFCCLLVN
jgi:hypothetical protein